MNIEDHALVYALLVKNIFKSANEETAEALVRDITVSCGRRRGERMRFKALENHEDPDLFAYFAHGEWKGREGENKSVMQYRDDCTVSVVTRCAWHDTWKKYGLSEYGAYYCRYIDEALCEGFDGGFELAVPSSLSRGDSSCEFVWNAPVNETELAKRKEMDGDRYILPFDFHVCELLSCAEEILAENGLFQIVPETLEEYKSRVSPAG